jgi:hypothetical protein
MTAWFPRCALAASVILVSACGGPQTPIAPVPAPNALSGSWVLPEAKAQDLVYVSHTGPSKPSTYILSLPRGELVGHLNVSGSLCSDNAGNVWIAEGSNPYEKGKLLEYAHGGEKPIRTLRASNMAPWACAVDPTSGNVAAADGGHEIDIYKSGSTQPEVVTHKKLDLIDVTYDNSGNLLILGGTVTRHQKLKVAELPKGATKIKLLRGFHTGILGHSGFQWEDKDLTLGDALNEGGHEIYRYEVGRRIKSRGVVELANGDFAYLASYWIQGSKAVATAWCGSSTCAAPIFLYNYPAGGEPIKELGEGIVPWHGGAVTISVAPK